MKILCYSPYNMWELHGMWEATILQALKLRGVDVDYVTCNGLYKDCDVFWAITSGYPRPKQACEFCQMRVSNLLTRLHMPSQKIGNYISSEELDIAERWSQELLDADFLNAQYQQWNIGEWVRSSVNTHFRINTFDFKQPEQALTYRNYLYSGLVAAFAFQRLLDTSQPDKMFIFNGRMSTTRVATELCKLRGIEFVCHERGLLSESLTLTENVSCSYVSTQMRHYWQAWKDIPLTRMQLREATNYMKNRELGTAMSWVPFSPAPTEENHELYERLNLNPDLPIWIYFPSSQDEVIAVPDLAAPFSSQYDWIEGLLNYVYEHHDVQLVIRVHPNIGNKSFEKLGVVAGDNHQEQQYYQDIARREIQGVRVVPPESDISSYSLMKIAAAGISPLSTTGIEMAMNGKPCLVGLKSLSADFPCVRTLQSQQDFESELNVLRQAKNGAVDHELMRHAARFLYFMKEKWNMPFPLVHMPDPHTGQLRYSALDELLPGRDAELDEICHFLMTGERDIYPTALDYVVTAEDEDLFWQTEGAESEASAKSVDTKEQRLETPVFSSLSPTVSVIIPSYNYADYLPDTLQSILAQSYQDYEIILIDDGSTDDTRKVCQRLLKAYPDAPLCVIHQQNTGQPAFPRNRGIEMARGQYILCLDADDKIAPQFLEECVAVLDRHPRYSIAYPRLKEIGDSHNLWRGFEYNPETLIHWNFIPTASVFRREAWLDVGGYATNVRGHEDWDFWIACAEKGHFGVLVDPATFYYRVHSNSLLDQTETLEKRALLKSQLMLNHETLYSAQQLDWARHILKQDFSVLDPDSDISSIPRFSQELSPRMQEIVHHWQQTQTAHLTAERLQQKVVLQRSLSQNQDLFLRWNPEQHLWECCVKADAEVFDWGGESSPTEELANATFQQIWVPSLWLKQKLESLVQQPIRYVPRFVGPEKTPQTDPIETEQRYCLALVAQNEAFWKDFLCKYIHQPQADQAMVLYWIGHTPEETLDALEVLLTEEGVDPELIPELILVEHEQGLLPEELLQGNISHLLIEPEADPLYNWLITALQKRVVPLTDLQPRALWPSALEEQQVTDHWGVFTQNTSGFRVPEDVNAFWNKHVKEMMKSNEQLRGIMNV